MIKLIACDLDNTLLNEEKVISCDALKLLRGCIDRGIYFAVASGRFHVGARKYAAQISTKVAVISYNGSCVTAPDGSVLHESYLSEQLIKSIIAFAKDSGLNLQLYRGDKIIVEKKLYDSFSERYAAIDRFIIIDDYGSLDLKPSPKALIFCPADRTELYMSEMKMVLGNSVHVTKSDPTTIELMPAGTNKGAALTLLAEHLCLPMSQTMAIGDNDNDVEMVRVAGIGVAVANSSARLKAIADYICEGENSLGVCEAVKKFCL